MPSRSQSPRQQRRLVQRHRRATGSSALVGYRPSRRAAMECRAASPLGPPASNTVRVLLPWLSGSVVPLLLQLTGLVTMLACVQLHRLLRRLLRCVLVYINAGFPGYAAAAKQCAPPCTSFEWADVFSLLLQSPHMPPPPPREQTSVQSLLSLPAVLLTCMHHFGTHWNQDGYSEILPLFVQLR